MKKIVYAMVFALCISGCNAQESKEETPAIKAERDSTLSNQPKVSWNVKKELDEDGNVIRYDSTYTWSYTNLEGDSMMIDADSAIRSFDSYIHRKFPSFWNDEFMTPIRPPMMYDSSFYKNFWRDDYFHHSWKKNMYDMDKIFKEMDSIRMNFFDETYPGLFKHDVDSEDKNK